MSLKDFLTHELDRRKWSPSDLEMRSGVSRGAIRNLLENDQTIPTLETLVRFGKVFDIPLWRMVELAGFDPGVPSDMSGLTARIAALSQSDAELAELLDRLVELYPSDVPGVLAYLEALLRRRGRGGDAAQ